MSLTPGNDPNNDIFLLLEKYKKDKQKGGCMSIIIAIISVIGVLALIIKMI